MAHFPSPKVQNHDSGLMDSTLNTFTESKSVLRFIGVINTCVSSCNKIFRVSNIKFHE